MSFTAAIDISTFIWCEKDFKANKDQYILLKTLAPNVYAQIRELNLPILLRNELYQSIMNEFPYNMVKEIGYDFQKLTLEFLTDTFSNWMLYIEDTDNSVLSVPQITKSHFSNKIQVESQSQKCHIFNKSQNPEHKYIAYSYFFNHKNSLVLNKEENKVEVDTLQYSTEEEIESFFEIYRLKFEHNPKHTRNLRYSGGEKISPFTCFHEENGEVKAKKLFEEAIPHEDFFYNFDLDNNVYVRFLKTHIDKPIYHGHDVSDENQDVPYKVKKHYNKDGKVF